MAADQINIKPSEKFQSIWERHESENSFVKREYVSAAILWLIGLPMEERQAWIAAYKRWEASDSTQIPTTTGGADSAKRVNVRVPYRPADRK